MTFQQHLPLKAISTALLLFASLVFSSNYANATALDDLAENQNFQAGRISSADPQHKNHDFRVIQPGETIDLGEIKGHGSIEHMWFTINAKSPEHLRELVLRIFWDGASTPAVECPLGDFYAQGFGKVVEFKSAPIVIGGSSALNCYWPMPFQKSARFTVSNEGAQNVDCCYYNIDYRLDSNKESKPLYFHTQYRQSYPNPKGIDYTFCDVQGTGHYVGTFLSVMTNSDLWWGEGNDKWYVDGATKPTIEGTGSEDYFCGAWDFGHAFTTDYFGVPYYDDLQRPIYQAGEKRGLLNTCYRWHILDPVPFTKSLKVDIEHGREGANDDVAPLRNNYSSVAYYYVDHPEQDGHSLPTLGQRIPKLLDLPLAP